MLVALFGLAGCGSEMLQETPRVLPVAVVTTAPVESVTAERDRYLAYSAECYVAGGSSKLCEQKCQEEDAPACVAVAVKLLQGQNDDLDAVMGAPSCSTTFGDGRNLLKKTCGRGSNLACTWLSITDDALGASR